MKSMRCSSLESSDGETSGNPTLEDISQVLTTLNEYLLIIDNGSNKVTWCSPGFNDRFPTLDKHLTLDTLFSAFEGLEECFKRDNDRESDNNVASVLVCYQGQDYFDADLLPISSGRQVLRLKFSADRESAIQRYLEDREQLFSTSRSVSVSEMATTLAHEINQPIGSISNLLRGIRVRLKKGGDPDQEEVFQAVDQAIEQTRFASNIIARIRDYTHARQPRKQSLDLAELVRVCVSLMDWEIKRDSIKLRVKTSNESIKVLGDKTMLQQVFVNLIRNAIDAMKKSPRVDRTLNIEILIDDREAEVAIVDAGCGFLDDAEKNFFVPFVSSKSTGMGVGLNICRSFIELHQGKLWLSSNEHKGCTSHVLLPIINEPGGRNG